MYSSKIVSNYCFNTELNTQFCTNTSRYCAPSKYEHVADLIQVWIFCHQENVKVFLTH